MSHTNVIRTKTNQRRGRGRGQGNQRQRSNNSNRNDYQVATENNFNPDYNLENVNSFNRQPRGGRGSFKNNNNFNRNTNKRSHSSSSGGSSKNNGDNGAHNEQFPPNGQQKLFSDPNKLPLHAQNPIFTSQLMERFTSLLPKSLLPTETPVTEQPKILSNQCGVAESDNNSFANISNNFSHGFRNTNITRPNQNYSNRDPEFSRANRPPQTKSAVNSGKQFENNRQRSSENYKRQSVDNNRQTNNNPRNTVQTGTPDSETESVKYNIRQKPANTLDLIHQLGNIQFQSSDNQGKPGKPNRKQILQQHGFRVDFEKKNITNTNKGNAGFGQDTSLTQSTVDAKFVAQLKNVEFNLQYSNKEESRRTNNSKPNLNGQVHNRSDLPTYSRDNRSNIPLFDFPRQIDNYNHFLNTQPNSTQNGRGALPAYEEPRNHQTNLRNASSHYNTDTGMTHDPVAGRMNFNISRPARDLNQQTLSQDEALRKIQDEYQLKLVEHMEKEKEKEAKKREQYLARYQHIDSGHRLNEGYLDEAAGYNPEFPHYLQSEEDIRERQQEQLWRDAQTFQQREREENEHRKQKEEKKKEEWMNKHRNINAGYKLGHGDKNQGLAQQTGTIPKNRGNSKSEIWDAPQQSAKHHEQDSISVAQQTGKIPKKHVQGNRDSSHLHSRYEQDTINPELVEGMTPEEALLRQEEQLILEALIYSEQTKKEEDERRTREPQSKQKFVETTRCTSSNSEPPTTNAKSAIPPVTTTNASQMSDRSAPSNSPESRAALRGHLASRLEEILSRAPPSQTPIPQELQMPENAKPTGQLKTKQPETKQPEISDPKKVKQFANQELMKTKLQESYKPEKPKLLGFSDPQNAKESEIKKYQKEPNELKKLNLLETPNVIKPASCVLRGRYQGAVLVLRPTEEALRKTLASRLEVQDEMDRCGESALYRPIVHPEVKYSNRCDRQAVEETGKVTLSACEPKTTAIEKESEPPAIDYQAEMRAARLRMQQKYEESLRKKEEAS